MDLGFHVCQTFPCRAGSERAHLGHMQLLHWLEFCHKWACHAPFTLFRARNTISEQAWCHRRRLQKQKRFYFIPGCAVSAGQPVAGRLSIQGLALLLLFCRGILFSACQMFSRCTWKMDRRRLSGSRRARL